MEKIKKWRRFALAALVLLFTVVLSFAVVQAVPAKATDYLQSNQITVTVTEDARWNVADSKTKIKKYELKNESGGSPSLKFNIDGEKYFSFEYYFNSKAKGARRNFTVNVDGVKYCYISATANTASIGADKEYIMKIVGSGSHVVEIKPDSTKDSTADVSSVMYFQNIRMREDLDNLPDEQKKPFSISYDSKYVGIYMIEGGNASWSGNKNSEAELRKVATEILPNQEYFLPDNLCFALVTFARSHESAITHDAVVTPISKKHLQSSDGTVVLSTGHDATSTVEGLRFITQSGKSGIMRINSSPDDTKSKTPCNGYALKDIMTERSLIPEVSYIDGEETKPLEVGSTAVIPYENSSLSIRVKSFLPNYQDVYKVLINGDEQDVFWEKDGEGNVGCSVSSVTLRSTVNVIADYGDDYIYVTSGQGYWKDELQAGYKEKATTFSFLIASETQNGLKDMLTDPAADITIAQDEKYPWTHEYGEKGQGGMAFSSGLTGLGDIGLEKLVTQLGFTVKGNGTLIFEFRIDGYGSFDSSSVTRQSTASFHIGSPVSINTWGNPESDFYKTTGTKSSVATDIGYGVSSTSKHQCSNLVGGTWLQDTSKVDKWATANNGYTADLIERGDDYEWYRASITISNKSAEETTSIYIAHIVNSDDAFTRMTIRNVGFYTGTPTVSWGIENGAGNDASSNGRIDVLADGQPCNDPETVGMGARLSLTATVSSDNYFYGWQEVIGEKRRFISYEQTTDYFVMSENVKLCAIIALKRTYAARIGDTLYTTLNAAFAAAQNGEDKNVIAVDDVIIEKPQEGEDPLTIPSGVKFIIPYEKNGDITREGYVGIASPRVSWATDYAANEKFRTPLYQVTLEGGATLTVNGEFYVGGVLHYPDQSAQGHTSGAYSEFINNGSLIVENGGKMDVCGRVTGEGSITVKNGGELYQPFMILDYSGGTNTEAMFNSAHVTPFKMYAMVNIQCKGGYTIEYGGILLGHASLFFLGGITTIEQSFITYDNAPDGKASGLLIMKGGSTVHSVYDDKHERIAGVVNVEDVGKTTITVNGNVDAGYMDFLGMVQTDGVEFALPYNYEVNIASGTFTVANHFKVMPGAVVTIAEGAEVIVPTGKHLHVYDSFYGPKFAKREYPTGDQLKAANYNPYASLVVNGKLTIESGAQFVGTVQTDGTSGTLEIQSDAILSASLHDGVATQYGCNYTSYTLKARVWDSAHGQMADLVAGTYQAVSTEDTWKLPGITFKYETQTGQGAHSGNAHSLATKTTDDATGLKGSWKVEHEEDVFDWNALTDKEGKFTDKNYELLERQCTAIGCTEKEHKLLLKEDVTLGNLTYTGAEHSNAELIARFKAAYGLTEEDIAKVTGFAIALTAKQSDVDAAVEGAGAYTLTIALTNGWFGAVNNASAEFDLTVDPLNIADNDVNVTIDESDLTYSGKAKTPQVTSVTVNGLTVTHDDYEWENNTNAGTAHLKITGNGNFTGTYDYTFEIKKAPLTLKAQDKTVTYGQSSEEFTYTATGLMNGEQAETVLKNVQFTRDEGSDVGTYAITVTATAENYEIRPEQGTYTIERASLTVTIDGGKSQIYGAAAAALTYQLSGVVGEEENSIRALITLQSDGAKEWANVTSYDITAWYNGSQIEAPLNAENGDVLKNYMVTVSGGTNAYTVSPKNISGEGGASATAAETTYNAARQEAVLSFTFDRYTGHFAKDTDYTVSYAKGSETTPLNAGTYTVTITGTGNYEGSITCEYVIGQASLSGGTITLGAGPYVYDGEAQTPFESFSLEGFPDIAQGTDYTVSYENNTDVSDMGATVTVTAKAGGNFKDCAETTFTIAARGITVVIANRTSVYGAEIVALTYSLKEGSSLGTGDQLEDIVKLTKEDGNTVKEGGYRITGACTDNNYTVTFEGENGNDYGVYTITPKPITVTLLDQGKVYDGKNAEANNAKGTGWTVDDGAIVNNDDLHITLTVENAGSDAKTYSITGSYANDNYTVTFENGTHTGQTATYTIRAKDVTVTLKPQTFTYNRKAHTYTLTDWTVKGLVAEGDRASLWVTLTGSGTAAGSYDVTCSYNMEGNYTVTFEGEERALVINKATITSIEVIGKEDLTYTGADQKNNLKFTVMAGDLKLNSDEYTVTYSGEKFTDGQVKNAGDYTVTVSTSDNNFQVEGTVKTTFTIQKKSGVEIKAEPINVSEKSTVASVQEQLKYTVSGLFDSDKTAVEEEIKAHISITSNYVESATVDDGQTYTITVSFKDGHELENYEVTFTDGTITITASVFGTVQFERKDFTYDGQTHTIEATGLPDGASASYVYAAEEGSALTEGVAKDAGTYTVTVTVKLTGYTDYVKTVDLTISAKPITVIILDQRDTYSGEAPNFVGTQWKTENEDDIASGDTRETLRITLTLETATKYDVKTYQITGECGNQNYAVTFKGETHGEHTYGDFVIDPRGMTVEILDQTAVYSGTAPTLKTKQDEGWKITNGEVVEGDTLNISLTLERAEGYHVRDYTITGSCGDKNYSVTFTGKAEGGDKGIYRITAKSITVKIGQTSHTYNGEIPEVPQDIWSTDELVSDDARECLNVKLFLVNGGGKDVKEGGYEIDGSWTNSDYAVTFEKGTMTISAVSVKITVLDKKVAYNGLVPVLTSNKDSDWQLTNGTIYSPNGQEDDLNIVLSTDRSAQGTTTIAHTWDNANYAVTFVDGKLTIERRTIEDATAEEIAAFIYDGTAHTPEVTLTIEGVTGEITFRSAYENNTAAGTATITLTGTDNFTGTKTVEFTIERRGLDVTIGSVEQVYGETAHTQYGVTLTMSENDGEHDAIAALMAKEESAIKGAFSFTTTAEQWSDVGSFEITATYEADEGVLKNYTVKVTNNGEELYTVKAKDITEAATMSATGVTYNGEMQEAALRIVFNNYLAHFEKERDYKVTYSQGEAAAVPMDAGTYTVTLEGTGNYTGKITCGYVIGKATIGKVSVTGTYTYTGDTQTPELVVTATGGNGKQLTLKAGEYTASFAKGEETAVKNAGTYIVTVTTANENYADAAQKANTTFEVKKAQLTVTADNVQTVYGEAVYGSEGKPFTFTVSEEQPLLGTDEEDVLNISLYVESSVRRAGKYTVKGTGTAENYEITVQSGTYEVTKKGITVTIEDHTMPYGNVLPEVLDSAWTAAEGAIESGDNLNIKLTVKDAAKAAGTYAITGTFENANYLVTFAGSYESEDELNGHAGKFVITPREVTVNIQDQSATYDAEKAGTHSYLFNGSLWTLVADMGSLAEGEEAEVLRITLQVGELSTAGVYAITGAWDNANYAVTFTGNYSGEEGDANNGHAGVYTIHKLDVSEDVIFMLLIGAGGDEGETEGPRTVRVKYRGTALPLTGSATLFLGTSSYALGTSLDKTTLTGIGNYTVKVTIEDTNYSGSTEFTVIVTDAEGYTQHLKDVLALLETLVKDVDKEHLKAEDYTVLAEVYKALKSLDAAEQEVGSEKLAEYEDYVAAWEEMADYEEVLETAESIANAPIAALFEAAAVLTALVGLAYIAMKGGML